MVVVVVGVEKWCGKMVWKNGVEKWCGKMVWIKKHYCRWIIKHYCNKV
jgi:hypothetical protein